MSPPKGKPVEVQIIGFDFFEVVYLKSKDVGAGGISIYVPHHFKGCAINRQVDLVITLPDDIPFKAKGVIRHKESVNSEEGSFGVYFTEINDKDRLSIKDFIQKNLVEP